MKSLNGADIVGLEPRSNLKQLYTKKSNWLEECCRETQKDRVKWNSKLHHIKNRFSRKSMYEQAEDLIDIVSFT